jgi:peptide/nickel transport system permease protein
MPPTIYLTLAGLAPALLIALPLGIVAALKRHSVVDSLCTVTAVAGQAMPIFWLGIMLIIVFAVRLRMLPASGTAPGSTSSCPPSASTPFSPRSPCAWCARE